MELRLLHLAFDLYTAGLVSGFWTHEETRDEFRGKVFPPYAALSWQAHANVIGGPIFL